MPSRSRRLSSLLGEAYPGSRNKKRKLGIEAKGENVQRGAEGKDVKTGAEDEDVKTEPAVVKAGPQQGSVSRQSDTVEPLVMTTA
jgi:hypothetical protein